ncbi:MAG: cupin domain-containing protein [Proteobacteria bacterium]|nr:cupin domain-containing protein [Pseudomonadota bacterium]
MASRNLFEAIPDDLALEAITELARGSGVRIERIVSRGHSSPVSGWYDQADDEWVAVLTGEAVLSFDHGSDVHLKPGDYITIPAHKRHRVAWTSPDEETIWLAVHYNQETDM